MYLGVDGFSNGWCCCSFNGDMTIKIIPEIKSDIIHYNPPPDEQAGRVLLVLHQTFLI